MTAEPLVSVIMNCYNGDEYLREAIDSVLSQTYQNWEIIFWDNQSSDGSAAIFQSYRDPRLKYYYAPFHSRLYEARNYAIEKASGEFLAFLDVDDWWVPDKLEQQVLLFSDPEVGVVCGNYWVVSEKKGKRWLRYTRSLPRGWVLNELLESYFPGLLTLVVRRSALDSLAYPCDPRYHMIGDLDLVIRLAVKWKLESVQSPVAFYRKHEKNDSAKHIGRHVGELELWMAEMGRNDSIRSARGWPAAQNNLVYLQALAEALRGNRRGARALFHRLPWCPLKVRLLLILFSPPPVTRRLKN